MFGSRQFGRHAHGFAWPSRPKRTTWKAAMNMQNTTVTVTTMTREQLEVENEELRRRLEEAEETIHAIQTGAVDAFVVAGPEGNRIYTLEAVDRPYRLFVEQMQQGAATLHADGTIVYCNPRLAEMLLAPQEKLVGASLRDFIYEDDLGVYDHLLQQGQTGFGGGEVRLRRSHGKLATCHLTFNPLPEGCGALIGVLITDLTSQRRHEASARLAAIVESSADAIYSQDLDGVITSWNAGAEQLFGYAAHEAIGRKAMELLLPEDRHHEEHEIRRRIRGRERIEHFETVRRCKDGILMETSLAVSPIVGADGSVVGASKIARDITERKRIERSLRESEEALKQADRRKDEFLATLAHELRNPLAPIRNSLHILRMTGDGNPAAQHVHEMME